MRIREDSVRDIKAVREVNEAAFGQEDEANLVDALRGGGYVRLSLVAEQNGRIVGHILFSELPIETSDATIPGLSLAPIAVLPEFQKQGIGTALVCRGLEICRERGFRIVIVLGHPTFYPRFGFSAELARPLKSPFSGEAWMVAELLPGAMEGIVGDVKYPVPFRLTI